MTTRMSLHLYILLLHCLKTSLQNPKQMNSAPLIYDEIATENRCLVHAGSDHAHYIIAIFNNKRRVLPPMLQSWIQLSHIMFHFLLFCCHLKGNESEPGLHLIRINIDFFNRL